MVKFRLFVSIGEAEVGVGCSKKGLNRQAAEERQEREIRKMLRGLVSTHLYTRGA
jgi:hypothetical protein